MIRNKKSIIFAVSMILAIILVVVGFTYAFWRLTKIQETENVLNTKCLNLSFTDGDNAINLLSAEPLSDEDGSKLNPYTFSVENICGNSTEYKISLEMLNTTTMDSTYVKTIFNGTTKNLTEYSEGQVLLNNGQENRILLSDTVGANETKNYSLILYIDGDTAVDEESMNKELHSKIIIDGSTNNIGNSDNNDNNDSGDGGTSGFTTVSFAEDNWDTIAIAVSNKYYNYPYKVGDTKTVTIAEHTNPCFSITGTGSSRTCVSAVIPEQEVEVRVVNISDCMSGETSESACGFIVEFTSSIDNYVYNKSQYKNSYYGSSKGSWRDSEIREYINTVIFNALPSDMQLAILENNVISGYLPSVDSALIESVDKLYLPSSEEIYANFQTSSYGTYDNAAGTSKQFDYYKNLGVNITNYTNAAKKGYNSANNSDYWLRSATTAHSGLTYDFTYVTYSGQWGVNASYYSQGISPVFKVG